MSAPDPGSAPVRVMILADGRLYREGLTRPAGEWPEIAKVSFAAGEQDTFYGTRLDLDGAFGLVGRSTFMDRVMAQAGQPREPAPGAGPGTP